MRIPLLFALVGSLCAASWAQTEPLPIQPSPLSPAEIDGLNDRLFTFQLKNVKPSLMAYWLDPVHHDLPAKFGGNTPMGKGKVPLLTDIPLFGLLPKRPARESASTSFSFPQGVRWITDVDATNSLLVTGNPENIEELTATINGLDQPLRRVEIQARFVRLSEFAAEQLIPSIDAGLPNGVKKVDTQFTRALEELENKGQVGISKPALAVTTNNFATALSSEPEVRPFPYSDKPNTGARLWLLSNNTSTTNSLVSQWNAKVTPTVINDNQLTVLAQFGEISYFGNSPDLIPKHLKDNLPGQQVVVSLGNGETVALRSPSSQGTTGSSKAAIVLLTARIINDTQK